MTKFLSSAAIIAALVASAGVARAADPDFCRDYARSAIDQYHRAVDLHCDWLLRDQAVWSPDYPHHYNWCRGVSREQADQGRDQRRDALDRCRDRRDNGGY
jgi:hypothetical protein